MLLMLRNRGPTEVRVVAIVGRHVLPISVLAYIALIESLLQSFLRDYAFSLKLLREGVI
jgi:hypothetical protein